MINRTLRSIARRAAPIAVLGLGATLSACAYISTDYGQVDGVALGEFDMGGAPPTELSLAGPDEVFVTEGDVLAITLEGDREAGEAIRFDRSGDRLKIARDSNAYDGSGRAIVRVTMPPARTLEIAGSGTIDAQSMARTAEMEIAGSGRINVAAIDADNVEVEIAGSGAVSGAGSARVLTVEIAGSGDVAFTELTADDVKVEIAGSGDVELASNGSVSAEIAGSGDVLVYGNATCSVEAAGSGSLRCVPSQTAAAASEESDAAAE
jgi:hypothetical protein